MNGPIKTKLVLDSNMVIDFANNKRAILPGSDKPKKPEYMISVVTEMEVLANPKDSEEAREGLRNILSGFTIIPLTGEIKNAAIEIRRSGSPRPKLPDAIVAATALVLDAPLASSDKKLVTLSYPRLQTIDLG